MLDCVFTYTGVFKFGFLKKYHCPHENEKTSKDHARQEAKAHTFIVARKNLHFPHPHMNSFRSTEKKLFSKIAVYV